MSLCVLSNVKYDHFRRKWLIREISWRQHNSKVVHSVLWLHCTGEIIYIHIYIQINIYLSHSQLYTPLWQTMIYVGIPSVFLQSPDTIIGFYKMSMWDQYKKNKINKLWTRNPPGYWYLLRERFHTFFPNFHPLDASDLRKMVSVPLTNNYQMGNIILL